MTLWKFIFYRNARITHTAVNGNSIQAATEPQRGTQIWSLNPLLLVSLNTAATFGEEKPEHFQFTSTARRAEPEGVEQK